MEEEMVAETLVLLCLESEEENRKKVPLQRDLQMRRSTKWAERHLYLHPLL